MFTLLVHCWSLRKKCVNDAKKCFAWLAYYTLQKTGKMHTISKKSKLKCWSWLIDCKSQKLKNSFHKNVLDFKATSKSKHLGINREAENRDLFTFAWSPISNITHITYVLIQPYFALKFILLIACKSSQYLFSNIHFKEKEEICRL